MKKFFTCFVALLAIAAAAIGPARGQTPHTVRMAEGTEDADNWSVSPAEATTTGVIAGSTITATYSGTRKVKSVKAVKYVDPMTLPLTMEALTAGNIQVNMSGTLTTGMKYSVNGGAKNLITTTTTIDVAAGDKVQFYGNGTSTQAYGNGPEVKLQGTAQTKAYGNIMSLLDEDNFTTLTALPNSQFVFYGLFKDNANLTDASGLLLPATTLANSCYNRMFYGCSSLTAAPALPATTLANSCYSYMFYGCSSLTSAPALPATTLAKSCYYQMFYGCSSLTSAPVLPATTLAEYCYYQMFQNCSNLNSVTCLATDISASNCIKNWLSGVAATGTFITPSSTNWGNGASGIPSGWTRVNADE